MVSLTFSNTFFRSIKITHKEVHLHPEYHAFLGMFNPKKWVRLSFLVMPFNSIYHSPPGCVFNLCWYIVTLQWLNSHRQWSSTNTSKVYHWLALHSSVLVHPLWRSAMEFQILVAPHWFCSTPIWKYLNYGMTISFWPLDSTERV